MPAGAILGIYARENGQGMVFELEPPLLDDDEEEDDDIVEPDDDGPPTGGQPPRPSGRPSLKVVK
ncbi:ClpXP protease specificity-enhancing factor [compost metagenome]